MSQQTDGDRALAEWRARQATLAEAPCPHPSCRAQIKMAPDKPEGTYRCICKLCEVRLSWITNADMSRQPLLTLVCPTDKNCTLPGGHTGTCLPAVRRR